MINSMDYIYGDGLDPKFKSGVKGNKILGYQEMLENKWRLEAQSLSSKDRVNEIVRLKKIEYENESCINWKQTLAKQAKDSRSIATIKN